MAPVFDFKALDASGKSSRGMVEAENQKAARLKLKKQGLMIVSISEKNTARPDAAMSIPFLAGRVSGREISLMTRQMASLVKSNIPLVEALTAMVDQSDKPALKIVLAQVRQDVNEWSSLAKAMTKHPKIFDNIYANMIEAGESSGTLGLVLLRLADLKEAQMRLRGKIISGMTYPVLMMCVSFALMLAIFTFVIPKLTKVFESMNKPMPAVTRMMMMISDVIVSWWFLFVGAGAIGAWIFHRYTNSAAGRPRWDATKLRLPLFGTLIRMIAITRFASTMATLLGSGVPILTAMNIAKNLVGSAPIARAIANARENITEGQSIAEPLKRSGEFPPMVLHMIAIGEKTGELPAMLKNVSETYEDQVNSRIDTMTSLIEPALIIFMGFGVVGVVLSVFIPLMDLSNLSR